MPNAWTERSLASCSGLVLAALGACVLLGWMCRQGLLIGLMPGSPPMVMSTGLMFVGSGLGLVAIAYSRPLAVRIAAAGVGILASIALAERLLDVELGIDWPAAHAWAHDGFPHPGRCSMLTAVGFVLSSMAMGLLGLKPNAMAVKAVLLLGAVVIMFGVGSGLGLVLGMDALYPSYAQRGMSIATSLGLALYGTTLCRLAMGLQAKEGRHGADRRIVSIGTLLLVVVALVTGLPLFFVVKAHIEDTIAAGMRAELGTEVQLVDTIVTLRMQRAAMVADSPAILSALRNLAVRPADREVSRQVQSILESFRPHGFSALRVSLANRQVLAASGEFLADPGLVMPLDSAPGQELLWRDGYYLHGRYEISDADGPLATLELEQPLPHMAAAIASGEGLGDSGELQLCKYLEAVVRCFPSRRNAEPFEIPFALGGDARLAVRAAAGGTGMSHGRDEHANQVIGVFAPVASYGLFAVLKMDTAELYGSLRRDVQTAMAMAIVVVLAGSLLFRALVKPMAAELVRAREISQGKSRTMERLHAFQRAVFDQAPDGILVADKKGRIVEANERMATLFGYAREDLTGRNIEDLVPESVRAIHHRHRAAFEHAPSTRTMSRDRTLHGQRADGTEFPIEVALAPLSMPDGNRVIAIVKDVTEARKAEQTVRDALKEKDVLLGEIHHRVKNNLQIVHSLLDMQVGLTTDERSASALRDSQNRIQSMALIHQTLYQSHDFAKVDFGRFLETLTIHLQTSYGRRDLRLTSRSESVRLSIDRAIPCGLIVNELVTNALKHAFPPGRPGSIVVEVQVLQGVDVEVAVIDDGVGIPDTLDLASLPSLGMQLVQVLSEQLHAELRVQRRDPTRISIVFPLE